MSVLKIILSHDFVEAALLRRAGWQCFLLTDTTGSYEEVPSNMMEYATRDRRWVQGNIQHLGLLGVKGLKYIPVPQSLNSFRIL